MQAMKKTIIGMLLFLGTCHAPSAQACTAAIISGHLTPDGRPLMWKNRDTSNLKNCTRYFKGEKFDFVAIVGYQAKPRSVWSGTNEAGFSIINTLSYNLSEEGKRRSGRNGSFMKRALEICRDIKDFRNYLDTLRRPMLVEANYGILDADGNGAFFEVDNEKYKEYNINDPEAAPEGYIVRSNFSDSGITDAGAGYLRYQQADKIIREALSQKCMTPAWIFSNLSRSFANPLTGIDLKEWPEGKAPEWFADQDFISRRSTSCAVVFQGVRPDEHASQTIMWTVIGYPPVTPAIPVWVRHGDKGLPRQLAEPFKGAFRSPLCENASLIRNKVFAFKKGTGSENYLNWALLYNDSGDGFMQRLEDFEKSIFLRSQARIESVRDNRKPDRKKIERVYGMFDEMVSEFFSSLMSGD